MSIIDRILLLLLALASLCASIVAFLLGIGAFGDGTVAGVPLGQYPTNVYTIVFSIVFVLIAIRFVFYRLHSPEVEHVLLQGEHGQIRISFDTIKQLANRTGKGMRGVQDFDTRVRNGQAGILLSVRVRVLPDIDLAHLSNEIQSAVKEYVEKTAGVTVERVIVNVAELAGGTAKSPRAWVE